MNRLLKTVELSFTSLEFYECCVVSTMHEGMVFNKDLCQIMIDVCLENFPDTPFIYVANRKNDYNVVPTIYLGLGNYPNFKGIAIVDKVKSTTDMPQFEKKFTNYPFEVFAELEEAFNWAENIIKK
ncbi:hypothetical protein JM83_2814 [Gillisia sp. Hel_I_86]|uniref:STAS/SEC14 domain-containing protein n=1 Tax=Gillisia sp. Hel_I_86 TaxID=1249981 RepID=UPI00119BAF14|nr:STAS/SEC14 domain-containing protein [Gillisia sp. Hel_I_86]TVZ27753.1 hypothetical protein JM83_2814 [Gillisia sp. Hel_I_86]